MKPKNCNCPSFYKSTKMRHNDCHFSTILEQYAETIAVDVRIKYVLLPEVIIC